MRTLVIAAFLVLSLLAGALGLSVSAQDATPAPDSSALEFPGVTIDVIAEFTESDAQGMALYSITLDQRAEVDIRAHYGSVTWYVDSGQMEFTVESGSVWVCTDACMEGPHSEGNYTLVPEGESVLLEQGDWAIQHTYSVHSYRAGNDGAVILASTTYNMSEPPPEASPAAAPSGPSARRCWGAC